MSRRNLVGMFSCLLSWGIAIPIAAQDKPASDQSAVTPSPFDATVPRTPTEVKAVQTVWAQHLHLKVLEKNSIGMDLIFIPPGQFTMGSPRAERGPSDDEKEVAVNFKQPLHVGRTEVTQGQWRAVMGTEPWKGQENVKEGNDYPATYVGGLDADAFCLKLSRIESLNRKDRREGRRYRLLTGAEWEYACRAGTLTRFCYGEDESQFGQYAWCRENADVIAEQYPHPVGLKKPNAFGLQDMHGNVDEWTLDRRAQAYGLEPAVLVLLGVYYRQYRGGDWRDVPANSRAAFKGWNGPNDQLNCVGFRIARVPNTL